MMYVPLNTVGWPDWYLRRSCYSYKTFWEPRGEPTISTKFRNSVCNVTLVQACVRDSSPISVAPLNRCPPCAVPLVVGAAVVGAAVVGAAVVGSVVVDGHHVPPFGTQVDGSLPQLFASVHQLCEKLGGQPHIAIQHVPADVLAVTMSNEHITIQHCADASVARSSTCMERLLRLADDGALQLRGAVCCFYGHATYLAEVDLLAQAAWPHRWLYILI